MREQYTTTQIFFLQQNVKGVTARELTEMFNACFETNKSVDAIRQYLRATGLSKFLLRTPRYTDEQLTFIYANKDLTIAELTERFNKRFGTRKMPKHIKYAKKARGWLREPNNRRPNQAQRIRVNKKNVRLDVYVYECVHGKLPAGYTVIHLDNDFSNNSIENLRAAPQGIRHAFSMSGYAKMPQVLAPALYAQVMLRHAIKRLSS
ncbi:TPA: HNH endonuclease [Klebsiella pneumoniae]|uniref:HNH endonuclease n=1 Tax=Klebsiella michiganensis TaxID=1134687 RepID=UPI0012B9C881|nr:HNH endonuclease [Klebsiella michiganensis]MDH8686359.1 HNH endonuclease [Klebsiella pneumoniae]MBA4425251.1 HNH endonuclease [Klebsiella michiganensis]HBQ2354227.1 HNH endonuclease [Klebsiella pneumoniae]HBT1950532.1 HNH endonuclease [Klebsiella pneumoniae]HBV3844911.1 HNH endonuclease [Klebsiella pneumoniae]